jgi:hypothetical protein
LLKSIEERGRARRIASKAYGAALALFVAILVASLFAGAALAATAVSIPVAHYDAYGNDNLAANLNDEYVVFKNNTTSGIVMTGWKVQDKGSLHTYYFPRGYVLGSGKSVVLHTGRGSNTASHLYWQRSYGAVWNNDHDTVTLRNSYGQIVVTKSW